MKIAILGYGLQGKAAVEYWHTAENHLTVCDQDTSLKLPAGVDSRLGSNHLENLDQYDLIVRAAPTIHPRQIIEANPDAPDILQKVTTVTNEFFRVCPTNNIIGVTGTKGKGTTSTLITKILEAAGHTAHVGGNIGTPPLTMLKGNIQPNDWVVLELANFQLIDIGYSPPIGVCVMVVPEHLDWHTDLKEYITAKQQMFRYQTSDDLAVFNRRSPYSTEVVSVSKGRTVSYEVPPQADTEPAENTGVYVTGDSIYVNETRVCEVRDVALPGRHNLQNVCAAIAATWEVINHDTKVITTVVQQLKSLPHRLEIVRTHNDITYYNDSFAAAPGAAIAAIQTIPQPKVMIIGGFDRQLDLQELVKTLKSHQQDIHKALFIGTSAERLAQVAQDHNFKNFEVSTATTMPKILEQARSYAQPGDAVVLSPGFPSFDMFKNFEVRGLEFRKAVQAL